ncbi:winged helix-turn-helix transcriptional regulator [Natrarchaeobius sp. A-rgal3]|uniref:winged helix-turn-helix transcriptional regulator n=1 Tax=Natrarchaeobius versutus TaxID=1679078 RepID=UPI00350FDD6B
MPEHTTDDWQRTWHHLQRALGNKWSFHVLHVLARDEHTFGGLEDEIDGISATVLARRLDRLRETGFVEKRIVATTPPRSYYRLTDLGRRVATFLEEMETTTAVTETPDGEQLVFHG